MGSRLEHFTKGAMQPANKQRKIWSTPLLIRKMKIKITRVHFTLTLIAIIQKTWQVWRWPGVSGIRIYCCWKREILQSFWKTTRGVSTGNTEEDFKRWPLACITAIHFWKLKRKRKLPASFAPRSSGGRRAARAPDGPGTRASREPSSWREERCTYNQRSHPNRLCTQGPHQGGTLWLALASHSSDGVGGAEPQPGAAPWTAGPYPGCQKYLPLVFYPLSRKIRDITKWNWGCKQEAPKLCN